MPSQYESVRQSRLAFFRSQVVQLEADKVAAQKAGNSARAAYAAAQIASMEEFIRQCEEPEAGVEAANGNG